MQRPWRASWRRWRASTGTSPGTGAARRTSGPRATPAAGTALSRTKQLVPEEFNYDFCCKLAAWNQHDADIPPEWKVLIRYLFSTSLRVEFQLQNSSTDLVLQQHAMPGRSASDMVQALGQHWAAGFLWTGSYQLLRWFECDADLQTSWARREYIEFGGGVGASSIAAALKGAQVTVVDAFVSRTLLQNLQENLPPALWPRIAICQMNWTKALPQNLAHLRACLRQSRARPPELKFDLIACGTSLYGAGYLVPLMKAISKPRTRVLLAPSVSLPKYMELWGRIIARYFERTTVRSDVGLTSVHRSTWAPHCGTGCPLFELSNPRGEGRARGCTEGASEGLHYGAAGVCGDGLESLRGAQDTLTAAAASSSKLRVVVDTDIGDDIDDTWALSALLMEPRVDLRLLVTDSYRSEERAQVLAKFLRLAGKLDAVPAIAVGPSAPGPSAPLVLAAWAGPADLAAFEAAGGALRRDAAAAIVEQVQQAVADGEELHVLVLSPCGAVAEALKQAPWIAQKATFTAMGGSLWHGVNGTGPPVAEWNVRADFRSSQLLYPHLSQLAPMDAAASAQLGAEHFARLATCAAAEIGGGVARALLEMYFAWLPRCPWPEPLHGPQGHADGSRSSVLYDAVAAMMLPAWNIDYLELRFVSLRLSHNFTVPSGPGHVAAAVRWRDMGLWEQRLVDTLCAESRILV
ncbi:unnamed protein product [Effrenium voratum]|nr:unnamed protein product [Effrenium voratum]